MTFCHKHLFHKKSPHVGFFPFSILIKTATFWKQFLPRSLSLVSTECRHHKLWVVPCFLCHKQKLLNCVVVIQTQNHNKNRWNLHFVSVPCQQQHWADRMRSLESVNSSATRSKGCFSPPSTIRKWYSLLFQQVPQNADVYIQAVWLTGCRLWVLVFSSSSPHHGALCVLQIPVTTLNDLWTDSQFV